MPESERSLLAVQREKPDEASPHTRFPRLSISLTDCLFLFAPSLPPSLPPILSCSLPLSPRPCFYNTFSLNVTCLLLFVLDSLTFMRYLSQIKNVRLTLPILLLLFSLFFIT